MFPSTALRRLTDRAYFCGSDLGGSKNVYRTWLPEDDIWKCWCKALRKTFGITVPCAACGSWSTAIGLGPVEKLRFNVQPLSCLFVFRHHLTSLLNNSLLTLGTRWRKIYGVQTYANLNYPHREYRPIDGNYYPRRVFFVQYGRQTKNYWWLMNAF